MAAALVAAVALCSTSFAQTTVTFRSGVSPEASYAGARDVSLDHDAERPWSPLTNYGSADLWMSGALSLTSLIRWELSSLPAGATLTGASLVFTAQNKSAQTYDVFEALEPWSEQETNWYQATSATSWAAPGAAQPGVDRGTTVLGTLDGSATTATATLNASGVAVVQGWIDGAENHGFVLHQGSSTDSLALRGSEHPVALERPALVLTFDGGTARLQEGVSPGAYAGTDDATLANGPNPRRPLRADGVGTSRVSALLSFDLSQLPPNAQVTSAKLELFVLEPTAETFALYELLQSWSEDEVTWTHRAATELWTTEGASGAPDRGTTELAQVGPASTGAISVELNAAGRAVVQQWISATRPNHGFVLQQYENSDALELADRTDASPLRRPALVVTYVLPSPDGGLDFPIARIAPETLAVSAPATVRLDGSASSASAGASITRYEWRQTRGPTGVAPGADATQEWMAEVPGTYEFELVVEDSLQRRSAATRAEVRVTGAPDSRAGPLTGCGATGGAASAVPALLLSFWIGRRRAGDSS